MSDNIYDLSFLKRISNEDQSFIIDMLETFRNTAPGIIDRMDSHLRNKKYEALSREAHRFIPGVSFLGVKDLEKDLIAVEENSKNNVNLDNLPELLIKVRKSVDTLIQCFISDFNLNSC